MMQQIAFYAPLKPPDHPVASGDRLMARLMMTALAQGGRRVALASQLRSYLGNADDRPAASRIAEMATAEIARLDGLWQADGPPGLWFCYHPYYKAPDLIGPVLCRRFRVPYVTAETSWSARRATGLWAGTQGAVLDGLRLAALNICLTMRDLDGLKEVAPEARTARLPPFIDALPFLPVRPAPPPQTPRRMVTVAMMRPGDKAQSYDFLARSLHVITDLPWSLTIIGDGPERAATEALFAPFAERVTFTGSLPTDAIALHLTTAALFVWPGCAEAYGLAYLEAQAAGVPVVAQRTAGVPEVVAHGRSGVLTPEGDISDFADAIRHLLTDDAARMALAFQAGTYVTQNHDLPSASARLTRLLAPIWQKS